MPGRAAGLECAYNRTVSTVAPRWGLACARPSPSLPSLESGESAAAMSSQASKVPRKFGRLRPRREHRTGILTGVPKMISLRNARQDAQPANKKTNNTAPLGKKKRVKKKKRVIKNAFKTRWR